MVKSKTLIYCSDGGNGNGVTYIADFTPTCWFKVFGYSVGEITAHEYIVDKAGLDVTKCVAGSISKNGSQWEMKSNSSSVNSGNAPGRKGNERHADMRRLRKAKDQLNAGSYKTVGESGCVNNGSFSSFNFE